MNEMPTPTKGRTVRMAGSELRSPRPKTGMAPLSRSPRSAGQTRHFVSEMVTLKELAENWRMDRKTVRRLLDQAGIRCYLFGPSRNASVRYRRTDVEGFLQACANRQKRVQ